MGKKAKKLVRSGVVNLQSISTDDFAQRRGIFPHGMIMLSSVRGDSTKEHQPCNRPALEWSWRQTHLDRMLARGGFLSVF